MSNLGNIATKESHVSGEMDYLSKSIDELGSILLNIVNCIEPILYHSPKVTEEQDIIPERSLCEFADRIRSLRYGVESLINRMKIVISEIEL